MKLWTLWSFGVSQWMKRERLRRQCDGEKEMIEGSSPEVRERRYDGVGVEGCSPLMGREKELASARARWLEPMEEGEGTRVSSTTQLAPAVPDSLYHGTEPPSSPQDPFHLSKQTRVSFLPSLWVWKGEFKWSIWI